MKRAIQVGLALGLLLASAVHPAAGQQASKAVARAATRQYEQTGEAKVIRRDDEVVYPFGHGQVDLQCARLRVCKVQLQAGEVLLSAIPGDQVRWEIGKTVGPGNTELITVKPKDCNLKTDLTLVTDHRIYQMFAESAKCGSDKQDLNPDASFTPLVKFYYPDETIIETDAAVRERVRRQGLVKSAPVAADDDSSDAIVARPRRGTPTSIEVGTSIPVAARGGSIDDMRFDYRWERDPHYPWVPQQVYDDGVHTYIRLPEKAREYETPVLFAIAPDGSMEMVNYAVRRHDAGDVYVVDRVLQRGLLVVGSNVKEREQRLLVCKVGVRCQNAER